MMSASDCHMLNDLRNHVVKFSDVVSCIGSMAWCERLARPVAMSRP